MTVYFIGAGPGAADLITVRGQRILRQCSVCLYAGSIMPDDLLAECPPGARVVDTGPLTLDAIIEEISAADAEGLDVARLHSGDPSSTVRSPNSVGGSTCWVSIMKSCRVCRLSRQPLRRWVPNSLFRASRRRSRSPAFRRCPPRCPRARICARWPHPGQHWHCTWRRPRSIPWLPISSPGISVRYSGRRGGLRQLALRDDPAWHPCRHSRAAEGGGCHQDCGHFRRQGACGRGVYR